MRRLLRIFLAGLLALALHSPGLALAERFEVRLIQTIDGDTARFSVNGVDTRVRFLGVDAPEMGFRRVNGRIVQDPSAYEPGATEAIRFVDRMLREARVIELEIDPARPGEDRFGRLRAWVWADGVLVQEELVRRGLAEIAFLQRDMRHHDRMRAAEAGR